MQGDVKIVARAIAKARWPYTSWEDDLSPAEREQCAVIARAAMAATLELTAEALGDKAFALAQAAQTDGQHNLAAGWADAAGWLTQRAQEVK